MPVPVPDVKVTWHVDVPRAPATRVHGLPVKVPAAPVLEKVTVPVGVIRVPGLVAGSVTVTVHVVAWLGAMLAGEQLNVVAVGRVLTTMLAVPLLGLYWFATPGYEAVTEAVPAVDAVKVEVHVADAVVPDSVQVVNDPVTPFSVRVTVPVGVVAPVAEVSVTVTVHIDPWLIMTGVSQVTLVVVV